MDLGIGAPYAVLADDRASRVTKRIYPPLDDATAILDAGIPTASWT